MATIIDFNAGKPARSAPPAAEGATAEIVIFPGIRYERHDEPKAKAASPRRGRRSKPDSTRHPD